MNPASSLLLVSALATLATGAAAQTTAQPQSGPAQSQPQIPQTTAEAAPVDAPFPEGGLQFSFNFGAATDYVFRGISQTKERTQGFVGADATYDAFYAGVWTSNIDYTGLGDSSTSQEIDLYAGWSPEFRGFALNVGAISYVYLDQPDNLGDVDYVEVYLKASRAMGPVTGGAAVFLSPEFSGETGDAVYYEASAAYAATDRLFFSGAIGRQEIDTGVDYSTFNVGGTYALTDGIGLDVRYWDTSEGSFADEYDGRLVASLKATF